MNTTGKVLVWLPWADRWRQVKAPFTVAPGVLLQVTPDSSAEIENLDLRSTTISKEEKHRFTIKTPMVVRLDRHLLREVKFETYYLHELPAHLMAEKIEEPPGEITMQLREAWRRVMAVFTGRKPQSMAAKDLERMKGEQEILLGINTDGIHLKQPMDQSTVRYQRLPTGVEIIWEPIQGTKAYKVMVWEAGTATKRLVAVTEGHRYTYKAMAPGVYHIQVTTMDGAKISGVHTLTIAPAPRDTRLSSGKTVPLDSALSLTSPPDHFQLLITAKSQDVDFVWHDEDGERTYLLEVRDESSGKIIKEMSPRSQASLKLKPGTYLWRVAKGKGSSVERRLVIGDATENAGIRRFQSALSRQADAIIFVD